MTVLRTQVVAEARTWLGTRFAHQARAKGIGCDCAGLVIGVARQLGLVLPEFDVSGYGRLPTGNELMSHCAAYMDRVEMPTVGDVCLLRFEGSPQHLAFFGDYPDGEMSLIHAYAPARKVIEARLDSLWSSRIVANFHIRGVV